MTDTPDFDAMAREIALNTSWNFPDHGGLTIVHGVLAHLISSALSKAYEDGRQQGHREESASWELARINQELGIE